MIRLDVEQGSAEWLAVRAGIVTASALDKILTPKKREPSKSQHEYLCRLLSERILGAPIEDEIGGFVTRGREMEPEAVAYYEFNRGVDVEVVGFCLRDDRRVGCSPDRFVGADGGLEVKCPAAHTHVGYLLDPSALVEKFAHQVQGNLWITGRKWWDVLSYNPAMPPVVQRVTRDEAYLDAIEPAVADFLVRLDAAHAQLEPLIAATAADAFFNNPFR